MKFSVNIRPKNLFILIIFSLSVFFPIKAEENSRNKLFSSHEIPVYSSHLDDKKWKVYYVEVNGYLGNQTKKEILDEIFSHHSVNDPVAIFTYGAYNSDIDTNRKIKKTYGLSDYVSMEEERDTYEYMSFLRIHCRIPTATEFKLEKEGKLEGDYRSRVKKEIECEKDLISKTWKGNGFKFWIHTHYYQLPDVTTLHEIPSFIMVLFTILGISFFFLFLYYLSIRYFFLKYTSVSVKILAVLGSVALGILIIFIGFYFSGSDEPQGPGLRYYFMNLFLLSGIYTILCFVPFWGLCNYLLLDDDAFPLWLILLGFLLAPLLVLAAGGMGGGSSSSSTGRNSPVHSTGKKSSSPVSSGGGIFGGGGASGQW